jgi:hypothetical protein
MSNSQCNNNPPPTKDELNDAAANILKATGSQACTNLSNASQDSFVAEMQGDIGAGFIGSLDASVHGSFVDSSTSSIGCEQLNVAAKEFAQSTKRVACYINEDTTAQSSIVSNINRIRFEAGGSINVKGDIDIKQGIELKLVTLTTLSTTVKRNIGSEVRTQAIQTLNAVQDSKSGFGATPQGAKIIEQTKNTITDESITNVIDKTLREIEAKVENTNEILFYAGKDLTIQKDFKVNQNMVIDIMASVILTNAVDDVLKNFTETMSTQTSDMKQTAENIGAEELGKQAGESAEKLVKARQSNVMFGVIGAIMCVILLGLFLKFGSGVGGGVGGVTRGSSKYFKVFIGFIIFLGIILLIAGGIMTNYAFKTYDEEYVNKVRSDLDTFNKCVTDKKDDCSVKNIETYKDPIGYKIGGIVLLVFGFVFLFYGLKLLFFNLSDDPNAKGQMNQIISTINSNKSMPLNSNIPITLPIAITKPRSTDTVTNDTDNLPITRPRSNATVTNDTDNLPITRPRSNATVTNATVLPNTTP